MGMCKKREIKVSQLHPISRKICPQCCHFIFKDFHANWPKTGSGGEELFILVLTSVNECEDCDNHHVTSMPMGKRKNLRVPERI